MSKFPSCFLYVVIALNLLSISAAARDQVDRVILVINDSVVTLTEFEESARINGINLERLKVYGADNRQNNY